jgi:hypothetical protein
LRNLTVFVSSSEEAAPRELFFRLGGKVLAARVAETQPFRFDIPVELSDVPFTVEPMGHQRRRRVRRTFVSHGRNSDDFPIVTVQNWALELARLVR